jgi:hypothetical protein
MPPSPPLRCGHTDLLREPDFIRIAPLLNRFGRKIPFYAFKKNIPPVFSGRTGMFEKKSGKNELEIP